MNEIVQLVQKNWRNLLRAKVGSLILIAGPLLVMLLAGIAFNNSTVYAIKAGVFIPDTQEITTKMVGQLQQKFTVTSYRSEKECVEGVKGGAVNACLVFVPNFKMGVQARNQVTFYVDYSKLNLVYAVQNEMTAQLGDESLEATQEFTKQLVTAIEYTQERVKTERDLAVKLSTQNEVLNKNTQEILSNLGDLDLRLNDGEFPIDNVTRARTQVKQWTESVLSLSDKSLSNAVNFIDTANDLVKSSSASSDAKNKLLENFQKSVDDVNSLKSDMAKARNLSQSSFAEFDHQIGVLTAGISDTKKRLNDADTQRQFSVRVLESMRGLLDQSLISVLEVQQALNDIDEKMNAIEITNPAAIAQPLVTRIKPIVQQKTYLNYAFPMLVVLIMMFTALLMTPTLILLEKNSAAAVRSYLTPVKESSFVIADFLTSWSVLIGQAILVVAMVSVFFSVDIASVPKALCVLGVVGALFVLMGMVVGYLFKSEEMATLAAVCLGALLLFVSDVIIPIESMPKSFAYIASFNPYVLGSNLLRKVLLFNASVANLADLSILVGYTLAFACIATGIYFWTRRYSLEQLVRDISPVLVRLHVKKK